jgi:hypothetical protein
MKKINAAKRLLLSTERIRVLRADQLVGARGGACPTSRNPIIPGDPDGGCNLTIDDGCKASKAATGGAN